MLVSVVYLGAHIFANAVLSLYFSPVVSGLSKSRLTADCNLSLARLVQLPAVYLCPQTSVFLGNTVYPWPGVPTIYHRPICARFDSLALVKLVLKQII